MTIPAGVLARSDGVELPRLLLFRWSRPGLPSFLTSHLREQVDCLRLFFDVTVVGYDCDYDQMCDRYQPQVAVFESGVYAGSRSIANTSSHPRVPKLGFLHADAFDASRATFISDMANWGVEDFFTTSVSMADYTPEIADRLFVWPNFVNPEIYRDYGEHKVVPVLFTGSQARHYPWRNAISRVVSQHYSTMTTPHFGWNGEVGSTRMVHGERYARMLNAATFVPACGSITNDLVRKHLEIPAAKSCLIAERTAALMAIGFRDMENCVFADASDVIDKLDHLFRHPDELERITAEGHALVYGGHTLEKRDQVLQWLRLRTIGGSEGRIVQDWPFGPLRLASQESPARTVRIVSGGRDRGLIAKGWSQLRRGSVVAAEKEFLRCMNYFFIPEAIVGLIFCRLHAGDATGALGWVDRTLDMTMTYQHAVEPDPVQWACRIRTLLCGGDLALAAVEANRYPDLVHPELDRIRQVVQRLTKAPRLPPHRTGRPRPTVTPLPVQSDHEWLAGLLCMLRACGQPALAAHLFRQSADGSRGGSGTGPGVSSAESVGGRARSRTVFSLTGLPSLARTSERRLKSVLRPLKIRWTSNDWSRQIDDICSREDVDSALIVCPSPLSLGERGLRAALKRNPRLPTIVEVRTVPPRRRSARTVAVEEPPALTSSVLRQALGGQGHETAGIVFLGRRAAASLVDVDVLAEAGMIILEGVSNPNGARIYEDLLGGGGFELLVDEGERGCGYVLLRSCPPLDSLRQI